MSIRESAAIIPRAAGLLVILGVLGGVPAASGQSDFVRGNCNADPGFDIADAVFLLGYLFSGGTTPTCLDACDGNDDGVLDIGDPVQILGALFGTPAVPLPAPSSCGADPTPDALDCLLFPPCPTVSPPPILVINEVDYDQPGIDEFEFVEIFNPTASAQSLVGTSLVLVNGASNTDYDIIDLSTAAPSLPAGGYLVVQSPNVGAPGLTIDFLALSGNVQNGAADGAALIHFPSSTVVDALSYEGSITAATITGFPGTVNLVEGNPTSALDNNANPGDVLIRSPNGSDTDDAATDWMIGTTPTPGAANPGSAAPTLVINEVDYDQPGIDEFEFVEIFNPTASPQSLVGTSLVLVNGASNAEYDIIDLSTAAASLPAGAYLVVKSPNVIAPGLTIDFASPDNNVQNGAADGMVLVHFPTSTVVDALSYEGSITMATITGLPGPVNLVEGTATSVIDNNATAGDVMIRSPNGTDTDDAATDWSLGTTPTPGAANP